jgi:hypothetical protein
MPLAIRSSGAASSRGSSPGGCECRCGFRGWCRIVLDALGERLRHHGLWSHIRQARLRQSGISSEIHCACFFELQLLEKLLRVVNLCRSSAAARGASVPSRDRGPPSPQARRLREFRFHQLRPTTLDHPKLNPAWSADPRWLRLPEDRACWLGTQIQQTLMFAMFKFTISDRVQRRRIAHCRY